MAYIGNSPGVSSQRIVNTFTATAGQTTFTPSSGYTVGYVDVYLNGIKLVNGTDYTASNGSTVVLTETAAADDVVEVMAYIPRGMSDGYTKSEADTRYVNSTGDSITGNLSFGDNDKAIFGAGSDLQIYHDATAGNSYIDDTGTGWLYLRADERVIVASQSSGNVSAKFFTNAQAELAYNNNTKLATTSTGIDVTGNVTVSGTGYVKLPVGTDANEPTASSSNQGAIRYNSDEGVVMFSDGSNWYKIASIIPLLTSVSGVIYDGVESTLTLAGTGFLTADLVVNFTQSSDSIDVDVTVTPTSDTAATVTVPSSVYSNVTGGNVVSISVTNSDGMSSGAVSKTAQTIPSGGTVTTTGSYFVHTFTSSGTFTVPSGSSLSDVEYLVIAGGGGGGSHGGGGAGGYRCSVVGENSGDLSSAESRLSLSAGSYTVTVGAGGAYGNPGNTGSNSVFHTLTSNGGGYGHKFTGGPGGSGGGGGGSGSSYPGGAGTSGQGRGGGGGLVHPNVDGGGGGGGAGGGGQTAPALDSYYADGGDGGAGITSSITGTAVARGGGGGGYGRNKGLGTAGGGDGRDQASNIAGTSGSANTGGGGGGNGGAGGSGIVVVRYQL
jgi:hypothetical protein